MNVTKQELETRNQIIDQFKQLLGDFNGRMEVPNGLEEDERYIEEDAHPLQILVSECRPNEVFEYQKEGFEENNMNEENFLVLPRLVV